VTAGPNAKKKAIQSNQTSNENFYHHPAFIQYKKKFSSIYLLFTLLYEKN
jgi:hypothetical protein